MLRSTCWTVLVLAIVLVLGGCSDFPEASSSVGVDETETTALGQPIHSLAQPVADKLARSVAIAMQDPRVRTHIRDAMRDSRFHEHKIHLRSFLKADEGDSALGRIAAAMAVPRSAALEVFDALPDMEFYLPEEQHRLTGTGGAEYYVMAVERPEDFNNPFVTLYTPDGRPVVKDVVNEMPELPVFAILPLETDFSRPDVPPRPYRGEAVQSPNECHPMLLGCTIEGVWSPDSLDVARSAISDTSGLLYRFWLARDRDGGVGSNEIEYWYFIEGTSEDPGDGSQYYADDVGAPCDRFTGIEPGQWYYVDRDLGDYYPKSGNPGYTDLGTEFWEDDTNACGLWLGPLADDWVGRTDGSERPDDGTDWGELYPSASWQEVWHYHNFEKQVEAYVSFKAPETYLLSVHISGPEYLWPDQSGTWTANVSDGTGSYSYHWYKDGYTVGYGQSYQTTMGWDDITLRVVVTDQGTQATDDDTHDVVSCSDPQDPHCW